MEIGKKTNIYFLCTKRWTKGNFNFWSQLQQKCLPIAFGGQEKTKKGGCYFQGCYFQVGGVSCMHVHFRWQMALSLFFPPTVAFLSPLHLLLLLYRPSIFWSNMLTIFSFFGYNFKLSIIFNREENYSKMWYSTGQTGKCLAHPSTDTTIASLVLLFSIWAFHT